MPKKHQQIGQVHLVQLQPNGLIIEATKKTPSGYLYDESRLTQTDHLDISPLGIEARLPGGEHVLDIHHIDHPGKEYGNDDLICIGFTAHYDAMRAEFGDHMQYGIAGENIVIQFEEELWPSNFNQQLGIESQTSGEMAILEMQSYAAPCVEFSHFCIQNHYEKIPSKQMKSILEFLGNGRRGFLFTLNKKQNLVTVRPGDKAFILSN